MKSSVCVLIVGVLVLHCAATLSLAQEKTPVKKAEKSVKPAAKSGTVTVVKVKGGVEVRPTSDSAWQPAKVGMKLGPNWEISTGLRGQALLRFEDNSEVLVQRLTEMTIGEFSRTPDKVKTRLNMKYGAVRVHVKKGTAANDFQVTSPTATASVKGTKIEEMSYYRGLGGKIRMGSEGKAQYKVNPTITVGPGGTTDDKGTSPIIYAKMATWVPITFSGFTKSEQRSAMWHGTVGAVVWTHFTNTQTGSGKPPLVLIPSCTVLNGTTNGTTNGNHQNGNGDLEPW